MRLLLVIDSLGSGGAQNQLTLLAEKLLERGHEVSLFYYFSQDFFLDRLRQFGVRIHYVPKQDKVGFSVIKALAKLYGQEKYDAVLSFLNTPNFYAGLAGRFSSHRPYTVISYRSKTNFNQMNWFTLLNQRWANSWADQIVANSHHERERWQETYSDQADKWSTIYNAVDQQRFQPLPTTEKVPERFICVGAVRPLKNAALLVEAMHILKKNGEKIPMVDWYGDQGEKNVRLNNEYDRLNKKLRKTGLTEYFRWFSPTSQINEILPNYTALIHPSLLEGLPNVVCEALSCGVPVMLSNILDHPRLVREGKNGWLFDPMSAEQLVTAIRNYRSIPNSDYLQMREQARASAENLFAPRKIVQQYAEVLNVESRTADLNDQ